MSFVALKTIFLAKFGRKVARDGDPKSLVLVTHDWGAAGSLSPWLLGGIAPPQWPDLLLLLLFLARETTMATRGGQISLPSRWGGSRPPPVARFIFFFSPKKVGRGGQWVAASVRWRWAGGGHLL
jgi:hypothetical protein